jgi:uncharacterized membrane protein
MNWNSDTSMQHKNIKETPGERLIKSEVENTKDSPGRSIAKAISWRVMGSFGTFLISLVIFRSYTNQSDSEVLGNATLVAVAEAVSKIILYYIHERLWANIKWGKYWKSYWSRRAWKKLYRQMHEKKSNH